MADTTTLFKPLFSNKMFSTLFENPTSALPLEPLPFHFTALMEINRKNMQALSDAQRTAFEGLQAVGLRQRELFSQNLSENGAMATDILGEGAPEDKFSKNADMIQRLYERGAKEMMELSNILHYTQQESAKILHKRVSASIAEMKASVEKPRKKRSA